jgi:hypothetical protein
LEEQGSEKMSCWKRWGTLVRSSTLGGAAENSMCDSDAARTHRWRMWVVHGELLDRFDDHEPHKLTRWDFLKAVLAAYVLYYNFDAIWDKVEAIIYNFDAFLELIYNFVLYKKMT